MDPTRRVVCPSLFPHIADDILQHVCRSTLITLRATNRAFKVEADKLLAQQLSLHHEYLTCLSVTTPSGQRIPGLRRIPLEMSVLKSQRADILAYTEGTKVVEFEGAVHAPYDARNLAFLFPNLETLRICTMRSDNHPRDPSPWLFMRYFPFPCKTVVLFFHECENGKFIVDPEDVEGEASFKNDDTFLVPRGDKQQLPESVTTLVVNLKGTEVSLTQLYPMFQAVKTVVIAFPVYRYNRHPEPLSFHLDYLVAETTAIILNNKSTRFIFVGLGKTAVRLRAALKRDFNNWGRRNEPPEETQRHWEEFIGQIEFRSRYAYADEIEDEVWDVDLHLVEWLSDPEVYW